MKPAPEIELAPQHTSQQRTRTRLPVLLCTQEPLTGNHPDAFLPDFLICHELGHGISFSDAFQHVCSRASYLRMDAACVRMEIVLFRMACCREARQVTRAMAVGLYGRLQQHGQNRMPRAIQQERATTKQVNQNQGHDT